MEPDPAADVQRRETYHILPDDVSFEVEIRPDLRRQNWRVRTDVFQLLVHFLLMGQTAATGEGFLKLRRIEGGILCVKFIPKFCQAGKLTTRGGGGRGRRGRLGVRDGGIEQFGRFATQHRLCLGVGSHG